MFVAGFLSCGYLVPIGGCDGVFEVLVTNSDVSPIHSENDPALMGLIKFVGNGFHISW